MHYRPPHHDHDLNLARDPLTCAFFINSDNCRDLTWLENVLEHDSEWSTHAGARMTSPPTKSFSLSYWNSQLH
jgi:hypothetical protein